MEFQEIRPLKIYFSLCGSGGEAPEKIRDSRRNFVKNLDSELKNGYGRINVIMLMLKKGYKC